MKSTFAVRSTGILVCVAVFLAGGASAALLTYEGFDYEAGVPIATNTTTGVDGGFGWIQSWRTASGTASPIAWDPGLLYANVNPIYEGLAESGRSAQFVTSQIRRQLDTVDTYADAGLRGTGGVIGENLDGTLYGSLLLYNANWGTSDRILLEFTGGTTFRVQQPSGGAGFRITTVGNDIIDDGDTPPALSGEQALLLVWRWDFVAGTNTSNMRFWINPITEASPSVGLLTNRNVGFTTITLRQVAGSTNTYVDEIRFGTTWESVAPIPEPGSLMTLLFSGGLLWGVRARIRRSGRRSAHG